MPKVRSRKVTQAEGSVQILTSPGRVYGIIPKPGSAGAAVNVYDSASQDANSVYSDSVSAIGAGGAAQTLFEANYNNDTPNSGLDADSAVGSTELVSSYGMQCNTGVKYEGAASLYITESTAWLEYNAANNIAENEGGFECYLNLGDDLMPAGNNWYLFNNQVYVGTSFVQENRLNCLLIMENPGGNPTTAGYFRFLIYNSSGQSAYAGFTQYSMAKNTWYHLKWEWDIQAGIDIDATQVSAEIDGTPKTLTFGGNNKQAVRSSVPPYFSIGGLQTLNGHARQYTHRYGYMDAVKIYGAAAGGTPASPERSFVAPIQVENGLRVAVTGADSSAVVYYSPL